MKAYTDLEQSKKLAEILPLESADMYYFLDPTPAGNIYHLVVQQINFGIKTREPEYDKGDIPCWGLVALLNILHSKAKDIPSLSGGGYKDGEYISDWCLDYEFENGDYQKTFADNPLDACVAMIEKLYELKIL